MANRPGRLLAIGAIGALMTLLLGVIAWTALDKPSGSPDAPFQLVSTRGGTVDQSIFKGRPSIVYFGYTHCPEVCPTTLYEVSGWLQALGDEGKDLQTLFFTVDPERDTVDILKPYLAAFSDRITGITGDPQEVRKVTDGWLVTAEQRGTAERYSMRHTTSLLLVGANGRLAGLIPYEATQEEAIAKIRAVLLDRPARPAV
ncbi:SCO family protein [Aureimonas frigidaquae]|uniref:SCO family protein n=1 Tax=Aureimonas frigidaquae TaxID=424757 RepID=UPI0007843E86|nr:SCO family protein [Aureimonas frigidaquae]